MQFILLTGTASKNHRYSYLANDEATYALCSRKERSLNKERNFVRCELSHGFAEIRHTFSLNRKSPRDRMSECVLRIVMNAQC